ncbi:hypothetical protein ACFWP5_07755 [Streptomyces sp. NPDC058469]|uniref:hypothetical protein n=1 Tax=Streptomyces sp. NPDC058469 TaxID=3346514 RepID=UPI00365B26BB
MAAKSLDAQLDSLAEAGVTRGFSAKISTRATERPEPAAAVKLVGGIRSSGVAVPLVDHEHRRLGRGIELAPLAGELKAGDAGLEFLTGELRDSHDPSGPACLWRVWTLAAPTTLAVPEVRPVPVRSIPRPASGNVACRGAGDWLAVPGVRRRR